MKRKTHDEFVDEMKVKHPELEVLGVYIGGHDKVHIKCKKCGTEFDSLPCNMISHKLSGCPHCAVVEQHKKQRKTHEHFLKEMEEIHPELTVLSSYVNAHKKVDMLCNTCGHTFSSKPCDLLHGKGCPKCGGTMRKTHEEFVSLVKEINPTLSVISEYKNVKTEVKILCNVCGHVFHTKPHNILYSKTGCPKCSMPRGELLISRFLDENNITYIPQYKFDECKNIMQLPFDFFLPDNNVAIEYDGIQHFEPIDHFGGNDVFIKRKENDSIKTKYCKENNIKLIRIPYTEINNIEEILEREIS